MKKRFINLLAIVCMLAMMIPMSVFGATEYNMSNIEGIVSNGTYCSESKFKINIPDEHMEAVIFNCMDDNNNSYTLNLSKGTDGYYVLPGKVLENKIVIGDVCIKWNDHQSEDGEIKIEHINIIEHMDKSNDHKCDLCDKVLSECNDDNWDHRCDICGEKLSDCINDDDEDHKCDICGKVLSDCIDRNEDHYCDICVRHVSDCVDEEPADHYCDICGEEISICFDKNKDHKCDICKKDLAENKSEETGAPKTDDQSNVGLFLILLTLSTLSLAGLSIARKQNNY